MWTGEVSLSVDETDLSGWRQIESERMTLAVNDPKGVLAYWCSNFVGFDVLTSRVDEGQQGLLHG